MGVARDDVEDLPIAPGQALQSKPLQQSRTAEILVKQMAWHGDQKPGARPQNTADFVQHRLDLRNVFQNAVAECAAEVVVCEGQPVAQRLDWQGIVPGPNCLLKRAPPGIDACRNAAAGQSRARKVSIPTTDVEQRVGEGDLPVESGFDRSQEGAKGRKRPELLP